MKTDIIFILDRSGSMESTKDMAIGSFNEFLRKEKKNPEDAWFTLVQFDDIYEVLQEGVPLRDAKELTNETFQPRGSTALVDAIGLTIEAQGKRFAASAIKPEKVVVVIVTDGGENASRIYSKPRVKDLIRHQEKNYNWSFYFVGANQDAIFRAAEFGILPAQAVNWAQNNRGYKGISGYMSNAIGHTRTTGYTYDASLEDRVEAAGGDGSLVAITQGGSIGPIGNP